MPAPTFQATFGRGLRGRVFTAMPIPLFIHLIPRPELRPQALQISSTLSITTSFLQRSSRPRTSQLTGGWNLKCPQWANLCMRVVHMMSSVSPGKGSAGGRSE